MNRSPHGTSGSFRLPHAAHARVEDAMHPGVISCQPETTLQEVARIMATKQIHCLIVARAAERGIPWTWGVISGLDLVRMAGAASGDSTAQDIASTEAVRVSTDDRLDHAAQLMLDHQVEHLIVVGAEHGRPVGVLSTLDIAGILAWGDT